MFQIFILSSVRSEFNSLDKPVFVSFALLKLKLSLIRQVVVFYSFFLKNISTCIVMSSLWNNFSAQMAIAQNLTINIERWKLSPCLALNQINLVATIFKKKLPGCIIQKRFSDKIRKIHRNKYCDGETNLFLIKYVHLRQRLCICSILLENYRNKNTKKGNISWS